MALQSLFYFKRMKETLNGEEFEYYLKAHVDFCIITPSDYTPLVAVELDSSFHDEDSRIEKDEIKNKIFRVGGIDLLRIRPLMSINETSLRQEVIEIFRDWRGKVLKNQPIEARIS
jgi:hypothetical protein